MVAVVVQFGSRVLLFDPLLMDLFCCGSTVCSTVCSLWRVLLYGPGFYLMDLS